MKKIIQGFFSLLTFCLLAILVYFLWGWLNSTQKQYIIEELGSVNSNYAERGVYQDENPVKGNWSYIISVGERPTTGYKVTIENVVIKNENIEIIIKEHEPSHDSSNATVITYPAVGITLRFNPSSITVKTVDGHILANLF